MYILVVEDDKSSAEVLKSYILLDFDYEVRVADTGEQAIEYLKAERPIVILLDYILKDATADEFIEYCKKLDDHENCPPIILISASDEIEKVFNRHKLPAMLKKPFELAQLEDLLHQFCRK